MRLPETLPNIGQREETHTLDLPQCCPISRNPQPGSEIDLTYEPADKVLEVGALYTYIHQYKGGLRDDTGEVIVRDMEQMIDLITQHCANAVGVEVRAEARLILVPTQRMTLKVTRTPEEVSCD